MRRKKPREKGDPGYDLFEDFDLIISSFRAQYGVKIHSQEFKEMRWDEFVALLSGIGPETPLGRVVAIRTETDRNVIKGFTKSQKAMHEEWQKRKVKKMASSPETMKQILDEFKFAFMQLAK